MSKPTFTTTYPATRTSTFAPTAKLGRTTGTTVEESVAAAGDDGFWDSTQLVADQAYTDVGFDDSMMEGFHSFFRFTTVAIPQGATILTATLKLIVQANASATFDMTIQAEDVDDSAQYVDETDADGASLTTASVTWTGESSWEADDVATSPSIVTVIQEIADRTNWASGNDLTFQLKYAGSEDSSESYRFKTFVDSAANAAVLTVTY